MPHIVIKIKYVNLIYTRTIFASIRDEKVMCPTAENMALTLLEGEAVV